jgi:hypothetical protein
VAVWQSGKQRHHLHDPISALLISIISKTVYLCIVLKHPQLHQPKNQEENKNAEKKKPVSCDKILPVMIVEIFPH